MGGHKSGSESDSGSDSERKHSKHDKHDKKDKHDKHDKKDKHDKEDKHKSDKHESGHYGSGSMGGHMHDIMPGHENYKGKLRKEDVQNLKHRTDISDEEREHRRKILMGEVAAGVVGTGVLGFAGYQAYQHFSKDDDKAVEHKAQ